MKTDPCTECGKSIEECEARPDCCRRCWHANLEAEKRALQESPTACAVADGWTTYKYRPVGFQESRAFGDAMDRLERLTRESEKRKVRS